MTKTFKQKITQYHNIQLEIKKEYYDKIFFCAKGLNISVDNYLILSSLQNILIDDNIELYINNLNNTLEEKNTLKNYFID